MTHIPMNIASKEFGDGLANDKIAREYLRLKGVVTSCFDSRVWLMTDACLSTILSLTLRDLTNPIGLNLIDGPASEKTTVLSFFYGLPMVYRSDDFTPASFVTQAANVNKKDVDKIDLLPRIKYKCLIVPELAPIFGAEKEELLHNFSILTRVFDGEGLFRDGAVQGRRGYEGDFLFTWLGASVPIKPQVWKIMGSLGSRFLFLSVPSDRTQEDDIREAVECVIGERTYRKKREECRAAIHRYFDAFRESLQLTDFARSVEWDGTQDDPQTVRRISELATITSRARSEVNVWLSDPGSEASVCDFSTPIVERPKRLMSVLIGLARGHALASGRNHIGNEELPLIAAIAFSSIPEDRRKVLELIIEREHPEKVSRAGAITSSEITDILSFSKPTAIKILRVLDRLEIGRLAGGIGVQPISFTLDNSYSWFCTEDFLQLRSSWRTDVDSEIGRQD